MRHLQIYRAINAIARHGSIRKAASHLAISPSALNRQVQAIEDELGAPLFERLAVGVRLSVAGEIYLKLFRGHLAEVERASTQIADLAGSRAGTVRIGVSSELAGHFLPQVIAQYQASFPGVDFVLEVIRFDEAQDRLRAFDVDLVVAVNPIAGDLLEVVFANDADLVAVLSEAAAPLPEVIRISTFAERPLIVPTGGSGLRNLIDAAIAARQVPVRIALEYGYFTPTFLHAMPEAMQLLLAVEVDADLLSRHGLVTRPLAPRILPVPSIQIVKLRGRSLPVTATNLLAHLSRKCMQE
ncbi:MAG: LysR family transcriptional regulator [Pseudomonadota bacterium]